MYLGRIYESVLETEYYENKPDIVKSLADIGIDVKDLEYMDERDIFIVFQNAGLNPWDYEI